MWFIISIILWVFGGYFFESYWDESICDLTDSLWKRVLARAILFAFWPLGIMAVFVIGLGAMRFLEDDGAVNDQ